MSVNRVKYKEDLVTRIRDLIDGYDSSSILKEYLQNADDSGATELIITFDKKDYSLLKNTKYAHANSPALLLSNNSVFKEKDFESIVKISSQGKVEDALATGRFGQGFSSSFSISDHPSFISNGRAYWFDVRMKAVSKDIGEDILYWDKSSFPEIESWIETFKAGELNLALENKRTIFRLPLRTQKYLENDIDSSNKISDEIFTYEDFLSWCDEWKDQAENLLFLRNIDKLVLQEVDENGNKIIHVSIETDNSYEIRKFNDLIQTELNGDILDICTSWLETEKNLPLFKYKQYFTVSYQNRESNELELSKVCWAVVNGLFRGKDNALVEQALKALEISPNPRKVLPWAGAAVRLDKDNIPTKQKNKWFTFLHLPLDSKHPVHLHGWFDLNSKRTEITHGGSGHDKETLIEWNELLLKHGVGPAWAILIDFVKTLQGLNSYYSFWPKTTDTNNLAKSLIEGFYQKASELECLYVKYRDTGKWEIPTSDIYYLGDDNETLFNAFQKHFKIIYPKPKSHIVNGFKGVGVALKAITPSLIRDYLYSSISTNKFPVLQKNTEITMLSKKDWFISIMHYCVSDDKDDYSIIEGLPLQLTSDGKISVVGRFEVLFDNEADFELYQYREDFILDQDLVKSIENYTGLPSFWLEANLKNMIDLLIEYGREFKLTKEWLSHVVQVIVSHRDEIDEARETLNSLPMIYQEDKRWRTLGIDLENRSPIIIEPEDKDNINILKQIGMYIVHPDYIEIYKPLAELGLIAKLSPETLSYYLLDQPNYDFFKDELTQEFIVDILMKDTAWYDQMNKDEKEYFRNIPFIRTISNQLLPLSSNKLFIATEFKPPEDIEGFMGEFELIKTKSNEELAFYKNMGIQEQTIDNYIKNVIIDFLEKSDNNDAVVKIWKWLILEWSSIMLNMETDQKDKLINYFKHSKIVPDRTSKHGKHQASSLYSPHLELPSSLYDEAYYPIIFEEAEFQGKWEQILAELDISNIVFSDHIVRKVMQIADQNDEKAYSDSIEVLNYIIGHFDEISELTYSGKSLLETLKRFNWFPAASPEKYFLKPSLPYKPLMNPNDLIRQSDAKIMGGINYLINEHVNFKQNDDVQYKDIRKIVRSLGIVADFKIEMVYKNFRILRELKANSEDKEKEILNHAVAFYQYIGRKDKLDRQDIPEDILDEAIRIDKYWVSPDYVFETKTKLKGIYSWDSLLKNIDSMRKIEELRSGLHKLGVKQYPDINILVELLKRLPLGISLEKEDLKQAKKILAELQKQDDIPVSKNIPLISKNNVLIDSRNLYIDDLSAYHKAKEKNENIEFCAPKYKLLAKKLNVESLHEAHTSEINADSTEKSDQLSLQSSNMLKMPQSQYFKKAILRLLYSEDKILEEEIEFEYLDDIFPTKIYFVKKLVIDYFIDNEFLFREYHATTYREKTKNILYVLEQEDKEDIANAISSYICHESDLGIEVAQNISKILRKNLNNADIEELLDHAHVRTLPDDKDLEIDDEDDSIYFSDDEKEDGSNQPYFSPNDDIDEMENEQDSDNFTPEEDNAGTEGTKSSEEKVKKTFARTTSSGTTRSPKNTGGIKTNEQPTNSFDDTMNPIVIEGIGIINDILNGEKSVDYEIEPPITPLDTNESGRKSGPVTPSGTGNRNSPSSNMQGGSERKKNNVSNSDDLVSSNDFKPVYLGKEREKRKEKTEEEKKRAKKIGEKGEQAVLSQNDLLLSPYNYFEQAKQNNPGYDIVEKDREGNEVRYIEVKTLTGMWGKGGVSLTPKQVKYALKPELKDKWWLFVVEGINTGNTQITQFPNPVYEANKFMFDSSWKQLAYQPEKIDKREIPKVDECYEVLEDGIRRKYKITRVKSAGEIAKVWAKREDSHSTRIVNFDSSWRKCDG